jgi:hypothetical protein
MRRVGPQPEMRETHMAKYGGTRTSVRLGAAAIALSALVAGAITATASAAPTATRSAESTTGPPCHFLPRRPWWPRKIPLPLRRR